MNKELINKYKPEFDHWLNEGKLLYKHINSNVWWNNEPWDYSPDYVTAIIINDDYAEFRKALAEGKVIESKVRYTMSNNSCHYGEELSWSIDTSGKFKGTPDLYRIKPDEPKFKVGDFVRYIHSTPARALEIKNNNKDRYYFTNSEMSCLEHELEPWTPVKGEWCWFYDSKSSKSAALAQFDETFNDKFISNNDMPWHFCEPFLNSLPSHLKDK